MMRCLHCKGRLTVITDGRDAFTRYVIALSRVSVVSEPIPEAIVLKVTAPRGIPQ